MYLTHVFILTMRLLLLSSLSLLLYESVMGECNGNDNQYNNGGVCTDYTFLAGKALVAAGTNDTDYQWENVDYKMLKSDNTWVAVDDLSVRTGIDTRASKSNTVLQKAWYANGFCSGGSDGSTNSAASSTAVTAFPKDSNSIGKVLQTADTCAPAIVSDTSVAGTNTPTDANYLSYDDCLAYAIANCVVTGSSNPGGCYYPFPTVDESIFPKGCFTWDTGDNGYAFYYNNYDDDVNGINDDPTNPGDPAVNCNAGGAQRQCVQNVCAAGGSAQDALWYDISVGQVLIDADGSSANLLDCPIGSIYHSGTATCSTTRAVLANEWVADSSCTSGGDSGQEEQKRL